MSFKLESIGLEGSSSVQEIIGNYVFGKNILGNMNIEDCSIACRCKQHCITDCGCEGYDRDCGCEGYDT